MKYNSRKILSVWPPIALLRDITNKCKQIGDLVKLAITIDLHSIVLGSNPSFSTMLRRLILIFCLGIFLLGYSNNKVKQLSPTDKKLLELDSAMFK